MSKVSVRLFADIREKVGESEVDAEGETVGDVIDDLISRYPSLENRLMSDGELRPHLNLTVDGEPADPDDSINEADKVAVFPPVSGG